MVELGFLTWTVTMATLDRNYKFKKSLIFIEFPCICPNNLKYVHFSFIYWYSIDHTDVEFVIKYKYKQFVINIVIDKHQLYTNTISDREIHVIMEHKFEPFLTYQTPTRDESKYSTQLIHIKKLSWLYTFQSTCTLYYLFISILAYFLVDTIIKILLVVFINAIKNIL